MKGILIFTLLAISLLSAQKVSTIADNGRTGGWGALLLGVDQVNEKGTMTFGARGAWLFANHWSVGGFFNNQSGAVRGPQWSTDSSLIDQRSLGFLFEYTLLPESSFHMGIPVLAGWGEVDRIRPGDETTLRADSFLYLEGGLSAELNMTESTRLALGGAWQQYFGLDHKSLQNEQFSGPTAYLLVKWGQF